MYRIIRGHVVSPRSSEQPMIDCADGGIVVDEESGTIAFVGTWDAARNQYPDAGVDNYGDHLLLPGFVDCHVHYPQVDMIASPGLQLLEWLETYTFPTEAKFADRVHAQDVARAFLDLLKRNGVTTACVYSTVHAHAADALFAEAQRKNMRIITGKVCMDRNAPAELLDSPETAYRESEELICRWHGVDRLEYAITPRFAPTSTPQQLAALGELAAIYPEVVFQTHLSENTDEGRWVAELFPEARDYTAVYESSGLVRRRSVFGHAVHLSDSEISRLGAAKASIAHCPTSNLFLGSGLFGLKRAWKQSGLHVGLGSDVGAGTSLSPWQTLNEAYKVSRLNGEPITAFEALKLATLDSAEALGVSEKVGSLEAGKDADIVVINPCGHELLDRRMQTVTTTEEIIFALMMLGDDRTIEKVIVAGQT